VHLGVRDSRQGAGALHQIVNRDRERSSIILGIGGSANTHGKVDMGVAHWRGVRRLNRAADGKFPIPSLAVRVKFSKNYTFPMLYFEY